MPNSALKACAKRAALLAALCLPGSLFAQATRSAYEELQTFSGGLNCVVVMKKMRSRNATSTMGVMSIAIPIRFAMPYEVSSPCLWRKRSSTSKLVSSIALS